MNAILFYVTETVRLTGSTINALEYFLECVYHNPEFKLYLLNGTKSFKRLLQRLAHERYDLGKGEWEKAMQNVVILSKYNLPAVQFDKILILDYVTIKFIKGVIRANEIIVISEKYSENPSYFLDKDLYNVKYYGEMPFHYKDHHYRMKFLFNRYRKIEKCEKGTYINSPRNPDLIYQIENIMKEYDYLPTPFIFKSKVKPEENLFQKFTHYLYYHANKWFDPHPRLFVECRYYDKVITYVNPHKIKDGSWYRYNDLLDRGLYDRTLNLTDEIIGQLI